MNLVGLSFLFSNADYWYGTVQYNRVGIRDTAV